MDVNRILWHQRLFHIHTKVMGRTSEVVNVLPRFYSDTDLYGCDVCFTFKVRRNTAVHGNTRMGALKLKQGISLHWVFIVQKYHDK